MKADLIFIASQYIKQSASHQGINCNSRGRDGGTMKGCSNLRAWAAVCLAILLMGAMNQRSQNALKVQRLLKTIEKHHSRADGPVHTGEVTEQELNDFIGFRLEQEKRPYISSLRVHLLDDNRVQGKIIFDAQQLNLGLLFGEALDFDFKGILHTRHGAARLDLSTLMLRGRPVSPQTADMVLNAIALCNGTEPSRIDDWYALPKGIKRIVVKKGNAALYY